MKPNVLIGSTGFVGSNLMKQWDAFPNAGGVVGLHSTDIGKIDRREIGRLIIAGMPGDMQAANKDPYKDELVMTSLTEHIKTTKADKVWLVSTSYAKHGTPYGQHRRKFEEFVNEHFKANVITLRLPGIFGPGLKKNLIYDAMHLCPTFLTKEKLGELADRGLDLELFNRHYAPANGTPFDFKRVAESQEMIDEFKRIKFTSLSFWHPDDMFYWYDISRLLGLFASVEVTCSSSVNVLAEIVNDTPISAAETVEAAGGDVSLLNASKVTRNCDALYGGVKVLTIPKTQALSDISKYKSISNS